jgi:hypothetical protein
VVANRAYGCILHFVARRPALPPEERLAVQEKLQELYRQFGTDRAIASWLDATQQGIHHARTNGVVGPFIARALYDYLGTTREEVLATFRAKHDLTPTEDSDAEFLALGLGPDPFRARLLAARRAAKSKQWAITPSAIKYVCTAPEWQAPQFETCDTPFWIDVMKARTLAEARMQPATEEEREFQEALRAVHEKRAKERRKKGEAALKVVPGNVPPRRRRKSA